MKHFTSLFVAVIVLLSAGLLQAESVSLNERINAALEKNVSHNLTTADAYGTPLIIKLARQGDIKRLTQLTQHASNRDFLNAQDKYGNNLFHVAKDAQTVQALASLFRKFYGAEVTHKITQMVDKRNSFDETPLQAQINAGHADTFQLLYSYSSLKATNDDFKSWLPRSKGSNPALVAQNKGFYCETIRKMASAKGHTLLQAAQGQVPYHPEMAALAQRLGRMIPCLAEN